MNNLRLYESTYEHTATCKGRKMQSSVRPNRRPGSCWIRLVLPGCNKERCDLWEIDGITVINGIGQPSCPFGEWKRVRGELGLPAIQT